MDRTNDDPLDAPEQLPLMVSPMVKRARQHDLFMHSGVRAMLDLPATIHRELGLPDDVHFPPLFDEQTERRLKAILALDDVTPGKVRATLKSAIRQTRTFVDMWERMEKVAALFNDFAFTKAETETMPEGYRQAVIVQRRRQRLAVVPRDDP